MVKNNANYFLKLLKYVVSFAFAFFILYFLFRNQDPIKLIEEIRKVDTKWVILSMIFGAWAYVSRGLRWIVLIDSLGYNSTKMNSITSVSVGYFTDLKGYLEEASEILDSKFTPRQFIKELLEARRTENENLDKTVLRFLPPYSGLNYFLKIDDDLFGVRIWPSNKLFQTYVQLASKYRNNYPYKKELYKDKAIQLLESNKIDIPDKDSLIKTLRRL